MSTWEGDLSVKSTPLGDLNTIPKLLARNAKKFADKPAYREKEFGIWQTWTWAEVNEEISALANGLLLLGVKAGDHIAVVGRNRPTLYWSLVAAEMVGAVPVPVYADAVGEEIAYVLEHCAAQVAIVGDQEQVDKLLEIKDRLPDLEQIVYVEKRGMRKYDHSKLHDYRVLQARGRDAAASQKATLDARLAAQDENTTCVMLYTSGTTGKPKGVVLSNKNILSASASSSEFDSLRPGDEILAYLPIAWVGDFIFAIGQAYWTGFCVNCPESAGTMQNDLREIGPTYFFSPPRIFETMLTSVMIRMEDASAMKRWMFK
jgi:long-chain acyl-CoA synthetase